MNTWDILKEVSAEGVRREAASQFVLALAGDAEAVEAARAAVLGASPDEETRANGAVHLCLLTPPYTVEDQLRLRHADLLVSLTGGPGLTEFRPADTIAVDAPSEVVEQTLAHRPDLAVPLGRRFPAFRPDAAEGLIRRVSRVNAEFATVSSLATAFPGLAPFFPLVAGADLVMLTKNQILLIFRLAAIYNHDLELGSRVRELMTVAGAALGWRTLARSAAAVLPGPIGLATKAGVAYSATFLTGKVAEVWFAEGRRPTRADIQEWKQEAAALIAAGLASVGVTAGQCRSGLDPVEPGEEAAEPTPAEEPPAEI